MKTLYRKMNEQILPPGDMKARVLAKIEQEKKRKPLHLRPLGVAAAILAAVLMATPVMAAYGPSIEELMYQIAPQIASRFSPVQESDENNGIRMEVVASSIHGNTVELYLGFTDLEGKGRITLDTYPEMVMFTNQSPFLGFGGASGSGITEHMRHDPENGIYYSMTTQDFKVFSKWKNRYLTVREIYGNKLTAKVDCLYHYVDLGKQEVPVTLRNQETMALIWDEYGRLTAEKDMGMEFTAFGLGSNNWPGWMDQERYDVLIPGSPIQNVTADFAVTGAAYLDGILHLQVCREQVEDDSVTPVYELWFEDEKGEMVTHGRSISMDVNEAGKRMEYVEYLYEIPERELENYTLVCEKSEHRKIPGPWQVTFPLVESDYEE